jgi:hypothetical protein
MARICIQTGLRSMLQHPCCRALGARVGTAKLVMVLTALLFLYGQDLAPFRMFRGLSAVHRACLSAPLYKNNPLWVKELVFQMYRRILEKSKFLFLTRNYLS